MGVPGKRPVYQILVNGAAYQPTFQHGPNFYNSMDFEEAYAEACSHFADSEIAAKHVKARYALTAFVDAYPSATDNSPSPWRHFDTSHIDALVSGEMRHPNFFRRVEAHRKTLRPNPEAYRIVTHHVLNAQSHKVPHQPAVQKGPIIFNLMDLQEFLAAASARQRETIFYPEFCQVKYDTTLKNLPADHFWEAPHIKWHPIGEQHLATMVRRHVCNVEYTRLAASHRRLLKPEQTIAGVAAAREKLYSR